MLKYKLLATISFACMTICQLSGQTLAEAVQYSFYDYIGTARTAGVSGAFGALGGDQGAIFINPASLGTFHKSEFVISPTYFSSSTSTQFAGNSNTDNAAVDITAANMGLVFTSRSNPGSKWKTSNIIVAFNKVTDFERNQYYEGQSEGTIIQRFAERANGKGLDQLDPFEAGVAYDAEVLFDEGSDLNYEFDPLINQELSRNQDIRSDGGINELSFGWAGNYNNKLQVGFTVGVPIIRYNLRKTYTEEALAEVTPFREINYTENLSTSGTGLNLKFGIIAMPIKSIRAGISIASPTSYSLSDQYSTSISYRYNLGDGPDVLRNANSIDGRFEYSFITPWKTTGSLAYLVKTGSVNGFLSAEIDYLNYASSSFNLTSESTNAGDAQLENDLNSQINNQLTNAINARIGAEIASGITRLRAGYSINGSPYYGDEGRFYAGFSLGAGLRFDRFYFDIAYKTSSLQQGYLPYVTIDQEYPQLVQFNTTNSYISTTFGFKFGS